MISARIDLAAVGKRQSILLVNFRRKLRCHFTAAAGLVEHFIADLEITHGRPAGRRCNGSRIGDHFPGTATSQENPKLPVTIRRQLLLARKKSPIVKQLIDFAVSELCEKARSVLRRQRRD